MLIHHNALKLVMLEACKFKLKLRLSFQFTPSIKTSLCVWAVTWESIMPETKGITLDVWKKCDAHKEGEGYSYLTVSKSQEQSGSIIKKFKETHTLQNKSDGGRKWEISKTLERKMEKQARDVSIDSRTTAKTLVNDLAKLGNVLSKKTITPRCCGML